MSHVYTGALRNTELTAGNARTCGCSIARGTRSPRKVGMIDGGKRVKRGTGEQGTRGAGAGAGARGKRGARVNGGEVLVLRVQEQAGGRGHVGRARVVRRADRDRHV